MDEQPFNYDPRGLTMKDRIIAGGLNGRVFVNLGKGGHLESKDVGLPYIVNCFSSSEKGSLSVRYVGICIPESSRPAIFNLLDHLDDPEYCPQPNIDACARNLDRIVDPNIMKEIKSRIK